MRQLSICVFLVAALLPFAVEAEDQPGDVAPDDEDTVASPRSDRTDPASGNDNPAKPDATTAKQAAQPAATEPVATEPVATEPVATGSIPAVPGTPVAVPPSAATDDRLTLAGFLKRVGTTIVSGYTQIDYGRYDISSDELGAGSRQPLNENSFVVRRARLRLDNNWRYFGYVAEVEFFSNGEVARPVNFDLHAQIPGARGEPPLLKFTVGLFPVPFTYQNEVQPAFDNFFAERALFVDGFVPGRFDIGAAISGHIWAVGWTLAAQNGQPLEANDFAYHDPNDAKDYSGRIAVEGELVGGVHAAIGVSFLKGTGFSAGTAPTKDTFVWRDLNEDGRVTLSELIPIAGAPGRASENFDRWGLAGDLRIWRDIPRLGELRIDAELALGQNLDRFVAPADPVFLGRDQRGLGFYTSITQYVTQHAQLGFRYDHYEPNIDDIELFGGRSVLTRRAFKTYTFGVSARHRLPHAHARVHLEYAFQQNSLGRDSAGRPAQLDNGAARVRFEVVF